CCALHREVLTNHFNIIPFCEHVYIVRKVGAQDVISKIFQLLSGVPRQPVFYYIFFCLHMAKLQKRQQTYSAGWWPVILSTPFLLLFSSLSGGSGWLPW